MAILSTKAILIAGAGIALVGGAWAFSGSSADSEETDAGPVFEAEPVEGLDIPEPKSIEANTEERVLKMEISITAGQHRSRGAVILSDRHFKTFGNDSEFGGSGGASYSTLDRAAVAADEGGSGELVNINEDHEIIYDIIDNKRVLVDHGRKTVREAVLSEKPKVPFGMGERKISKNAKPEQEAALRKLMGQMTQARLDPKREIKLGNATGETESVTVNSITIDCTWNMINRAGGPIGKVCLTRDSKVPMASALRRTLLKMPLPAADKSDYLSYLRQLMAIEKSKLPVIIRLVDYVEGGEEPRSYEQWKITRARIAELGPDAFETPKGYSRPPR